MNDVNALSRRQFTAIVFISLLPPMIRRFPRVLAERAGNMSWLAGPLAIPALALGALLFWLLYRNFGKNTGYDTLLQSLLGPFFGALAVGIYTLWMLFYAGFLLRSGAMRFVSTIYPDALPGLFLLTMALACTAAACGSLKALGRTALLLRPLLAVLPVAVFVLTLKDADFQLLLPLTGSDPLPLLHCGLEAANLFGVAVILSFSAGHIGDGPLRLRDWLGWAGLVLGIVSLITAGCIAMFGPQLTARLRHPFFMLTRDVTILGALERVEPLAVAVWVFADFILISTLLWISGERLRCVFQRLLPPSQEKQSGFLAFFNRFCCPLLSGAFAAAAAFLLPAEEDVFLRLSDTVVPLLTAGLSFGFPLLLLVLKMLRKR